MAFRDALYRAERPNTKLANLVQSLPVETHTDSWQTIAPKVFDGFFSEVLELFPEKGQLHLVGSIAVHFEQFIRPIAAQYKWELVGSVGAPIDGLVQYHLQTNA